MPASAKIMRYLPLLLLASCVFDTSSMPGDVGAVDIYDGRGSVGVLGGYDGSAALADAADAAEPDAAEPDAAPMVDADAADRDDGGRDAGPVEVDASAPPLGQPDAATPPPPPPPAALCEQCGSELACAAGLSCRYSVVLLVRVCLPDLPASGTCAELCPGLPLPENDVCNPAPSTTGACSCD